MIHVNSTGITLQYTVTNNGVAVDLTGLTVQLVFTKPSGTQLTVTPTVIDMVNGVIQYTTQTGDINEVGYWQYQAIVSGTGSTFYSDIGNFAVINNAMARWQIEMPIILRHMINDLGIPSTYPDMRLQQLILVSAQFIQQELEFSSAYTIDIVNNSIVPDPTVSSTRDDAFINLSLAKSACIIDNAEARMAATRGVMLSDRGMQVDLRTMAETKIQLLSKGWCQNYADTKLEYMMGNTGGAGCGIIGPFRVEAGAMGWYGNYGWSPDGFGAGSPGTYFLGGLLSNDGRFR